MRILSPHPRYSFETASGSENEQAIIREVFAENVYEVHKSDLQTGRVVDLGANFGAFAAYCDSLVRGITVYAYEPEPHNFELLQANVELNHLAGVIPIRKAVAGEREMGRITNEHGGSRLTRYDARGVWPRDVSLTSADAMSEVEVITLEDAWRECALDFVDVLKIDVEGAETDIIVNAPESVMEQIAYIALEYDEHDGGGFGRLVEKLSETHRVATFGSHKRGAYVYARRY